MITKMSKVFGLLLFGVVCACTQSLAEDSPRYSVSRLPRYDGYIDGLYYYYLIRVGNKWTASKTGDTKDENVEAVVVDPYQKEISLYAWGIRPRGYSPETHVDYYWQCSPGLGYYKRETGGINICLSAFASGLFAAKVNQEKLLNAAKSSGLIAMVEHDYQAKLDEAKRLKEEEIAAREKEAQDRLAEDRLAEQGNANAKFQRGIFYLGSDRYNVEAEKWFEKAAALGHADALYKLALFQNDHYQNKAEAERLITKAAHAGSKEARVALDAIQAERERMALHEKQMAAQQAKERKQIAAFRKSISSGDESNCGPVIEVKGKLVKVAFGVANYGNEHWLRRDEIYPSGWGCRFVNGQYQPPQ